MTPKPEESTTQTIGDVKESPSTRFTRNRIWSLAMFVVAGVLIWVFVHEGMGQAAADLAKILFTVYFGSGNAVGNLLPQN